MLLNEILSKPVAFIIDDIEPAYFTAEFKVGGRTIRFMAGAFSPEQNTWEIEFSEHVKGRTIHSLSGSGNEFAVLLLLRK